MLNKNISIKLENGVEVSLQSSSYHCAEPGLSYEVAVRGPTGIFLRMDGWGDEIKCYQTPQECLDIICEAQKLTFPTGL